MPDRPVPGMLEERAAPAGLAPTVEGRRLRGVIPYSVESRDLGGWREVMEPACLDNAAMDDLVATVDHAGVPLGRFPRTLKVERGGDGVRWSVDLPESRSDVREAVERGDLCAASWRMVVKRDEWRGNVRHVLEVAELRDVAVVTTPAYRAAVAELRCAPEPDNPPAEKRAAEPEPEEAVMPEEKKGGGLHVEDRAATEERPVEARVLDAIASVKKGEVRALTDATADAITPPELSTYLFDKLRPASVALTSGMTVLTTDRESVTWPRVTGDVDPTWVAETDVIPAGDPAFGTISATPRKLAHRTELSNEVIDDSDPSVVEFLNGHLATMLGLKLDASIFTGNPAANANSIRGLKYLAGTQSIDMGTNGGALGDYDPFIRAVGLLRSANVAGPYAVFMNPRDLLSLELLRDETGSNRQLGQPDGMPPVYVSSQLPTDETKGTATNASSAYVVAPRELILVRRRDASIELDRSRLFDRDMSEMRAKLRVDLVVPNAVAVVRINGITPAA